jgi:hypothetical protein
MKAEKTAIRILALTAALLLGAILLVQSPATADVTAREGDYLIATHKASTGGDALYIADTRIGVFGVFMFDNNARSITLRAIRPIGHAFRAR